MVSEGMVLVVTPMHGRDGVVTVCGAGPDKLGTGLVSVVGR